MIREIVEDKESEGEGEGRPVREEGRYKIFGMFKGSDGGKIFGMFKGRDGGGEINRKTDKQRQTTNLFTLTHCASER